MKVWVAYVKSDLGPDFDCVIGVTRDRETAKELCFEYEVDGDGDPPEVSPIHWEYNQPSFSQGIADGDKYTVEEFELE